MTDNPFIKTINESLENINRIVKIKSNMKRHLDKATEALNMSVPGANSIELSLHVSQSKMSGNPNLLTFLMSSSFLKDDSKGYLFLSNDFRAELVASWLIIETSNEIALTINKVKKNYDADDEGFISAINDILSEKDIIEKAVELKKSKTYF